MAEQEEGAIKEEIKEPVKGEKPLAPEIEEMMEAGVHFGHTTSKTHPKMKPFISGVRNTVHVIDLEKTKEKLDEALGFLRKCKEEGKVILLVGTKMQVRQMIREVAEETGQFYVAERWIGGTITNFDTISKRLEAFKELERQKREGEFEKYTKKEQMEFEEQLQTMEKKFGGIKEMTQLPDVVVILDLDVNVLAAKEARKKGIPIVAVCDTNCDPTWADYPVPANDDAISSVRYVLDKVREALGGSGKE
ncbi:30S ribosomal protein S2 [Patescibacteria group bacterium]|nr:30S ribosomal protein S2 [Patescibacteria group bacterium]